MASYNKVLLMGNLTRDPQMKYLPSQTPVVEFGIACNRKFKTQTGEQRVTSRDFPRVKQTLLHHLTNRGEPFIHVADGNYRNRGELYLAHQWTGLEIDSAKAGEVLANLRLLWGRPVHLQARVRDEMSLLSCAEVGGEITRQKIGDDTPPPVHLVA